LSTVKTLQDQQNVLVLVDQLFECVYRVFYVCTEMAIRSFSIGRIGGEEVCRTVWCVIGNDFSWL